MRSMKTTILLIQVRSKKANILLEEFHSKSLKAAVYILVEIEDIHNVVRVSHSGYPGPVKLHVEAIDNVASKHNITLVLLLQTSGQIQNNGNIQIPGAPCQTKLTFESSCTVTHWLAYPCHWCVFFCHLLK